MEFKTVEAMKLAGLAHKGSYYKINEAWGRLCPIAVEKGLFKPGAACASIFFSNPMEVPEPELKSAACIQIQPDEQVPEGLEEFSTSGGKYAVVVHKGPYEKLGGAWEAFCGELANSSEVVMDPSRPCFEVYLNDPQETAPQDLLTELYEAVIDKT